MLKKLDLKHIKQCGSHSTNHRFKTETRKKYQNFFQNSPIDDDCLAMAVTSKEEKAALQNTKLNKAAETDGIYPEMLKNLRPKDIQWIAQAFTDIIDTSKLPSNWKTAKVIGILKPGKDAKDPPSY